MLDHFDRSIHVGLAGDQLGGAFFVIYAGLNESTGVEHRHGQRPGGIRVLLDEGAGGAKNFLRVVGPEFLGGKGGEADVVGYRPGSPGLADTEPVHVAHTHICDHLWRWHHDGFHVGQRVNAEAGEPVIEPHGMGAGGECLGEGQWGAALPDLGCQLFAIGHARLLQLFGEGDRLTVLVEPHEHGHIFLRPADAQLHAIDQTVEHMGGIQFTVEQFVAHAGPGCLFARCDGETVFFAETLGCRHHD
ncbi:hypothetical protein D3C84_392710 [compost metagenome]